MTDLMIIISIPKAEVIKNQNNHPIYYKACFKFQK